VLQQGVQGIADLISNPGVINLDFADVRTIMSSKGIAHMGIGRASGENRAEEAIKQAISSPLLDTTINGARGVLINMAGGESLGLMEANMGANLICDSVDPDAEIIFGTSINPELGDEIIITVIATDFKNGEVKPSFIKTEEVQTKEVVQETVKTTKPEVKPSSEVHVQIPDFLRRSR
jgi:cell division protein FtsZ